MSDAAVRSWLAEPMPREVAQAIARLRRAPDVQRIAVMPDVHLSADVCIGVALATTRLLYPQAVGGDIGCGMLAVGFDAEAGALSDPRVASAILADLAVAVPARRHNRRSAVPRSWEEACPPLSHPSLESIRRGDGALEFATVGSGNHFVELQADEDDRLWAMIHSGSRALGQAIRNHHLSRGQPAEGRLRALDAESAEGRAYLADASFARQWAGESRRAMAEAVARVLEMRLSARMCPETMITTDHNHVSRECHGGAELWVHRKGAMRARAGEPGVLPGSMGTLSFHVEGRGCEAALESSAHGAGRALSRTEARAKVSERELRRQMDGVWFESRLADQLRDEAPAAYKDIRAVLRTQRELVKVRRTLRPVLNYKGV